MAEKKIKNSIKNLAATVLGINEEVKTDNDNVIVNKFGVCRGQLNLYRSSR